MEDSKKHSLGNRAFLLFLSRRMKFTIFLFALTGAVWYSERWLPVTYSDWGNYAAMFILSLSIAYFVFIAIITYLEYRYYTYTFTEEAFLMTSGYMVRSETATLYHQIQNVNIERGPLDRLIGVSQIVILMSGSQRDALHNRIILPAVGKTKARLVQKELLTRARKHISRAYSNDSEPAG